jgi:hypothetical protein
VAEAVALEVVVADLGDPLDAQRLPRQVLLGVPAGGTAGLALALLTARLRLRPALPGVAVEGVRPVRLDLGGQLRSPGDRERGGHAHVVQGAGVVVEPEEQGAHPAAVLVPAEPGHDAVGGAVVLHLQHEALVLDVGQVDPLGDDPVEPGALEAGEPVGRHHRVGRHRRQVDRRAAAGQRLLQQSPALGEGTAPQVVGTEGEEVEGDEARRCLLGEQATREAAGWMRLRRRRSQGHADR